MSLKFVGEDHLCCIVKCSVVIAVPLTHHLIIGATVLTKKAVDNGVKGEQNLFDISNSSTSCMLLTSQQCLFSKQ